MDYDYAYAPTSASIPYSSYSGGPEGFKGEGIAGTPSWVYASGATAPVYFPSTISSFAGDGTTSGYPGGSKSRGAPANAGGGAEDADANGYYPMNGTTGNPNQYNSGGGGGGNGGAGGIGGYNWTGTATASPAPTAVTTPSQGIGGVAIAPTPQSVVMGGGGGAGSNNDASVGSRSIAIGGGRTATPTASTASSGGQGGGIIMLRVGSIASGTLSAQGIAAPDPDNDGGGGGGAGGTIVVTGTGTIALNANVTGGNGASSTGGNGGTTGYGTNYPHGTGGGGGGGVVINSGTGVTATLGGGAPGDTAATTTNSFGAVAGGTGKQLTNIPTTAIPGVRSGAECSLLLLAKRFTTKISGGVTTTYTTYTSDGYTDPGSNTVVDADPIWPSSAPATPAIYGSLSVTSVPNDVLEYTVYMLSAGGKAVSNGAVCDFVPPDQTLVTNAYNSGASPMKVAVGYTSPTTTFFGNAASAGASGVYPINTTTGVGTSQTLPAACASPVPKSSVTTNYSAAAVYYAPGTFPAYISSNNGYATMSFEGKVN
jgi:hypothetical protein